MKSKRWLLLLLPMLFLLTGCKNTIENPNAPSVYINFKVYPNSLHYQDLNTVSGWMYVTSESPSRGIIIYRMTESEFKAYDRIPPNEPNACCDAEGNCTRLVVDFPFVVDDCSDIKYNILDGSIIEGEGTFPLIEYHTSFDGTTLRVYN